MHDTEQGAAMGGPRCDYRRRAQALSTSTTHISSENPTLAAVERAAGNKKAAEAEEFAAWYEDTPDNQDRSQRDPEYRSAADKSTCAPRQMLTEFYRQHGITRSTGTHWY